MLLDICQKRQRIGKHDPLRTRNPTHAMQFPTQMRNSSTFFLRQWNCRVVKRIHAATTRPVARTMQTRPMATAIMTAAWPRQRQPQAHRPRPLGVICHCHHHFLQGSSSDAKPACRIARRTGRAIAFPAKSVMRLSEKCALLLAPF